MITWNSKIKRLATDELWSLGEGSDKSDDFHFILKGRLEVASVEERVGTASRMYQAGTVVGLEFEQTAAQRWDLVSQLISWHASGFERFPSIEELSKQMRESRKVTMKALEPTVILEVPSAVLLSGTSGLTSRTFWHTGH